MACEFPIAVKSYFDAKLLYLLYFTSDDDALTNKDKITQWLIFKLCSQACVLVNSVCPHVITLMVFQHERRNGGYTR